MTYKIEKNIPFPTKHSWNSDPYPWNDLDIGDSFLVDDNASHELLRDRVWASQMRYRRRVNAAYRIKTQKLSDGLRVWRVA
jgi:hypothetical protein